MLFATIGATQAAASQTIHVKQSSLGSTTYTNRLGQPIATCPTVVGAHFVITDIDTLADAPTQIIVQWSTGPEIVPLAIDDKGAPKFTGGTAHYLTSTNHNGQPITDATADIYDTWSGLTQEHGGGEFNLSHYICADTAKITITEPKSVNNVGPDTKDYPQSTTHPFTVNVTGTAILSGTPYAFSISVTGLSGATIPLNGNTCATVAPNGTNSVTCTVTITSTTPTQTFTAHAMASGTVGTDKFDVQTDGTPPNSGDVKKTFACQTHDLSLSVTGAGKSQAAYTNFTSGAWGISFLTSTDYDPITQIGTWSAPVAGDPSGSGIANLTYSATLHFTTPTTPYSTSAYWKFQVLTSGGSLIFDSGPSLSAVSLPNSGNCNNSDSAISPVSTVTLVKAEDANGDGVVTTDEKIFGALSGWSFTVSDGIQTTPTTVGPTDENGGKSVDLDDFATWTICEVAQNLWIQTVPSYGGCFTRLPQANVHEYVFGNTHGTSRTATALQTANGDSVALNSAMPLGTSMRDTATVTTFPTPTGAPAATGTVTFKFYKGDCTGQLVSNETIALGTASTATGALGAGSYAFLATYSGDTNYAGSTADCEAFSISKGTLTLTTDVKNAATNASVTNTNVALGATVYDTATLGNANANFAPSGTVTFSFLNKGNCTTGTAVDSDAITVNSTSASSLNRGPLSAANGPYAFSASYAGDPNYNDISASDCEPFGVSKGDLALTTTMYSGQLVIANSGELPAGTLPRSVRDTATASGIVPGFAPANPVTFAYFANGTCANTGSDAGSAALVGNLADGSATQSVTTNGAYSFEAAIAADGNYNSAAAGCESFTVTTVTIGKLANGGNSTFNFTLGNLTPSITTTGTPGGGNTTVVVLAGDLTLGETSQPGWQLVSISCAGGSATFTAAAGSTTACNVENTHNGATRTQGFWSTHTDYANAQWAKVLASNVLSGFCQPIGNNTAAGKNQLMGSFWANVAKTSTGTKRSDLDQARMQLAQQLTAALLNRYGLGADDGGKIATAMSKYCTGTAKEITTQVGILGGFNQSGDTVALTDGRQVTSTAKSKTQADIAYWDKTTH